MAKHRIVVAGCGSMSNTWVKDVQTREDARIVGLVDLRHESAQAMAERYGLTCGIYTDLREALQETKANLVFDVTVPASHFTVCSTALQMGADVFGEKPMAESMAEGRELVA